MAESDSIATLKAMFQPLDLSDLLDRPIAFHRAFVEPAGSVAAALMLSQAVYWSKRTTDKTGWFYKTQEEWQEETGLSRSEQEIARKHLRASGFWNEQRRSVPAKLFYRIDFRGLQSSLQKSAYKNARICSQDREILQSFTSSETTTETTSQTTEEKSARKLATLCPDEMPADLQNWAMKEGVAWEDCETEWAKMHDWSHGNGQKKQDWAATWRNWIRRRGEHGNGKWRSESFAERNIRTTKEACDAIGKRIAEVFPEMADGIPEPANGSSDTGLFGGALGPQPGATGNGLRRRD